MVNKLKAFIRKILTNLVRMAAYISKEEVPAEHNVVKSESLEQNSETKLENSSNDNELTNMYLRYFILKIIIIIFEILIILDYFKILR